MYHLTSRLCIVAVLTLSLVGCGDEALDEEPLFQVSTGPLWSESDEVYFSVFGDGLPYETLFSSGVIVVGEGDPGPRWGTLSIGRLPEGRKTIWARGIGQYSFDPLSSLPNMPSSFYYLAEHGHETIILMAGEQARVTIFTVYSTNAGRFGTEDLSIMGDYEFDGSLQFAGSDVGDNITTAAIRFPDPPSPADPFPEGCTFHVKYWDLETYDDWDRGTEAPIGLFTALPTGGNWGDPSDPLDWPAQLTDIPTVGGEAIFYIVAKPGIAARDVMLLVTGDDNATTCFSRIETGQMYFRIGGYGGIEIESTP